MSTADITYNHCYANLFTLERRQALKLYAPGVITLTELCNLLHRYEDDISVCSRYYVKVYHGWLAHIKFAPAGKGLTYQEVLQILFIRRIELQRTNRYCDLEVGAVPQDEAREQLTSSIHQDVHQVQLLENLNKNERRIQSLSPYSIPSNLAKLLATRGVPSSSYQVQSHNHPAHKMLESVMLENIIHYIKDKETTVAFMKQEKFNKIMRSISIEERKNKVLLNKIISSNDLIRYPFVNYTKPVNVKTPVLLLHDSLMYNTMADIYALFKRNENLKIILATVVIPIETEKYNRSLYPELYSLEYLDKGKIVVYKPERHGGASYQQPYSAIEFLKRNLIITPDITLSITKVNSLFAHHILLITKIPTVIPKYNVFDIPDLVKLPNLYRTRFNFKNAYLPRDLVNMLAHYVKTLKEVDRKSINAIIKTQMRVYHAEEIPLSTLEVLADTIYLYAENGYSNTYRKLNLTRLKKGLSSFTLSLLSNYTIAYIYRKLYRSLIESLDLKDQTFTKKLKPIMVNARVNNKLSAMSERVHFEKQMEASYLTKKINDIFGELKIPITDNLLDKPKEIEELAPLEPEPRKQNIYRYVRYKVNERKVKNSLIDLTKNEIRQEYNMLKELYGESIDLLNSELSECEVEQENVIIEKEENEEEQSENEESSNSSESDSEDQDSSSYISESTTSDSEVDEIIQVHTTGEHNMISNEINPQDDESLQETRRQEKLVKESSEVQEHEKRFHHLHTCGGITRSLCYAESCPVDMLISSNKQHKCLIKPEITTGLPVPTRNACLLEALAQSTNTTTEYYWRALEKGIPSVYAKALSKGNIQMDVLCLQVILRELRLNCSINIKKKDRPLFMGYPTNYINNNLSKDKILIKWQPGHWSAVGTRTRENNKKYIEAQKVKQGLSELVELDDNEVDDFIKSFNKNPGGFGAFQKKNKKMKLDHLIKKYNTINGILKQPEIPSFKTTEKQKFPKELNEIMQLSGCQFGNLRNSKKRAKVYSRALKSQTTGTLGNEHMNFIKKMDKRIDHCESRTVRFALIQGSAGSGKSSGAREPLRKIIENPDIGGTKVTIITPRDLLRQQWVDEFKTKNTFIFKTFEKALVESCNDIVILDELQLFPPGYLAYLLYAFPNIQYVIALTDVAQGVFYEPEPQCLLKYYLPEAIYYKNFSLVYKKITHRLAKGIASLFGIPTTSKRNGEVKYETFTSDRYPILVPSNQKKKVMLEMGYDVLTYTESQGFDLESDYQILVNKDSKYINFQTFYTIMTRGKGNVIIVLDETVKNYYIEKLLNKGNFEEEYNMFLKNNLANKVIYINAPSGAGRKLETLYKRYFNRKQKEVEEIKQVKLTEGFEYLNKAESLELKHYLTGYPKPPTINEVEVVKQKIVENKALIKLPVVNPLELIAPYKIAQKIKEDREQMVPSLKMQTDVIKEGEISSLLQHQQLRDKALKKITMDERIDFTTKEKKLQSLKESNFSATLLITRFQSTFLKGKRAPDFNLDLLEKCILENEMNKLEKPLTELVNQEDRTSPDWEDSMMRLFIKSQWVKKKEKILVDTKPGQALACFNARILMLMGPIGRYMMYQMEKLLDKNIFINSRKNQEQLNDFVKKNYNNKKLSVENDYTQFDKSQGPEFVKFQAWLMKYLNIPKKYIDTFLDIKLNGKSIEGLIDWMILTGEWCTFFFNTMDNLAYAALKYDIPKGTMQMYGGDDSVINHPVLETKLYKQYKDNFKLKSKTVLTDTPTFCGWILFKQGIIKDPQVVYFRLMLAKEQGKLLDSIESLYYDHLFAYLNYEVIQDGLNLEQLMYHQLNCRFFVQNKNINRFYFKQVTDLEKNFSGLVFKKFGKGCF